MGAPKLTPEKVRELRYEYASLAKENSRGAYCLPPGERVRLMGKYGVCGPYLLQVVKFETWPKVRIPR